MTITQFLKRLRSTRGWRLEDNGTFSNAIRRGCAQCPLTALARMSSVASYPEAGKLLGLSVIDWQRISITADERTDLPLYDPKLRARLLRACKLVEGGSHS